MTVADHGVRFDDITLGGRGGRSRLDCGVATQRRVALQMAANARDASQRLRFEFTPLETNEIPTYSKVLNLYPASSRALTGRISGDIWAREDATLTSRGVNGDVGYDADGKAPTGGASAKGVPVY